METISSVNQVKNHNVRMVKNALKSVESGTKNTVSKMTGLSIATCNTILNELAERKEILEIETGAATIGRPPKVYRFNESFSYICCIFPNVDAKIWKLEYAITDLLGNIKEESSVECAHLSVDVIADFVRGLMEKEPLIRLVSFGNPGYYYENQIHFRGVAELEGVDLVSELSARLNCEVCVENDMNAMAYGIYCSNRNQSAMKDGLVMIAFFEGERVGSGIVLNGKILHGKTGYAGEINVLHYGGTGIREMISSGRAGTIQAAVTAVRSYIATINPAEIIFVGGKIEEGFLADIEQELQKHVQKPHIPELTYLKDFRSYYIRGLSELALECLDR